MLSYAVTLESISSCEPEATLSMRKTRRKICCMNFINFRHHPMKSKILNFRSLRCCIYMVHINYKILTQLTMTLKERKSILEVVLIHTY